MKHIPKPPRTITSQLLDKQPSDHPMARMHEVAEAYGVCLERVIGLCDKIERAIKEGYLPFHVRHDFVSFRSENERLALYWFLRGEGHSLSSNIAENMIAGFGALGQDDFEYPLPTRLIEKWEKEWREAWDFLNKPRLTAIK